MPGWGLPQDVEDLFFRVRGGRATAQEVPRGIRQGGVRSLTRAHGLIPASDRRANQLDLLGQKLFRIAIPKAIGGHFADKWRERQTRGVRTRVWLQLCDARSHCWPWELLSDPSQGPEGFLALERFTPLVRCLRRPKPGRQLKPVEPPLRILGVTASPIGEADLDTRGEQRNLERALRELKRLKLVELKWISGNDTARQLQEATNPSQPGWHVIHFICHGGFSKRAGLGLVVFADASGRPHRVNAAKLKNLLAAPSLRMVVLNSCHGALSDGGGLFASTAAKLAQMVPAVVAMQTAISDPAALAFSSELYDGLAGGLAVDRAVTEARIRLSTRTDFIEWPTPVLYLDTLDGGIFPLTTVKGKRKKRRRTHPTPQPSPPPPGNTARLRPGVAIAVAPQAAAVSGPAEQPAYDPDDPQKGHWGGQAEANGRCLLAEVEAKAEEWFVVRLRVEPLPHSPKLTGAVLFHLHDSFSQPIQVVRAKDGQARLSLVAWGAFTVGVEADRGKTRLELDLKDLPDAPSKFRSR